MLISPLTFAVSYVVANAKAGQGVSGLLHNGKEYQNRTPPRNSSGKSDQCSGNGPVNSAVQRCPQWGSQTPQEEIRKALPAD
jgi:hypothetical protein